MSTGKWGQKLQKFRALSGADKRMLLHAATWLAVGRLMLLLMPLGKLLAKLPGEQESEAAGPEPELLRRIGFAVKAAAANVPWRSDCFPQCIAGWMLLKHYGYNSTIHLGVEKKSKQGLAGHAWLTYGGNVVIGGENLDRYTRMLAT